MTEEQVDPPKVRKVRTWRTWLRRLGLAVGVLLALLILFHRPIFFHGTRYFVIRLAKQQNLALDYKMSGSIFSQLVVEDLQATPTGPGPIEHLSIERLTLAYSLPGFLRQGLPGLLEKLELIDARIEMTPAKPTEKVKGPRKAFKFPAIFPDELRIEDFRLVSHGPKGDLIIDDLDLILDPERPGRLTVEKLAIPAFRTWEKLHAITTYPQRNLRLKDLQLDESVEINLLNLDASGLAQGVLGLKLRGNTWGGATELEATISDLNASNDLKLEARLVDLPLGRAAQYLKINLPLTGQLQLGSLRFDGPLQKPSEWSGDGSLVVFTPGFRNIVGERVSLHATFTKGTGDLRLDADLDLANDLTIVARAELPRRLDQMADTRLDGKAELALTSLAKLPVKDLPIASGSLQAGVPFQLEKGVLKFQLNAKLANLASPKTAMKEALLTLTAEKPIAAQARRKPVSPYAGLVYEGKLEASEVAVSGYQLDRLETAFAGRERALTLGSLELSRASNRLTASGSYTLPLPGEKPSAQPLQLKADIAAPALAEFSGGPEAALAGELQANVDVSHKAGGWNGTVRAKSGGLSFKNITVASIDVEGVLRENMADFPSLNLRFDDENFVEGHASVALEKPFKYDANLTVNFADLSRFRSLLPAREGERPALSGALVFHWQGAGSMTDFPQEGAVQLSVKDAAFGEIREINATVNGTFSPDQFVVPGLAFSSSAGQAAADLLVKDRSLQLTNLSASIPGKATITGTATLPLDLRYLNDRARLMPADGPIVLDLTAENIALAPLLKKGEKPPPVTGRIDSFLKADGTLAAPNLRGYLKATELKFATASDLAPARLDSIVELKKDRLKLMAYFYMQGLSPLTVEAAYPFSIPEVLARKQLDPNAQVEARIDLPASPLNFLARLSDQVRRADGRLAIDARLTGTLANPKVAGDARLDLTSLRFSNQNIPPVSDFNANLVFTEAQLQIERFAGALAGGPFALSGNIGLQPMNNPSIDLRLQAKNTLLTRNETVTVRANADVSVKGTLESSAVTGSIAVTNSRFFREIDILPLQLPGRPAPKPPSRPNATPSLPPPLAGWTFDLKLTTADPFLIRGNLASGNVNLDMKLAGTGENPVLDGYAYLDAFTASLPFSRLEVVSGYVYYTPDNPFVPVLDIYGRSEIRNYTINVYIYGEATNPETLFSSEPPLPQEDIISLLATGTTTEELTGDSSVAAGRAAALLLQKISRTFFKKKEPPTPGSFLDRFDLRVGTVDPRTGNQEVETEFRLSDRFYILGDLDVQGQISGQVKYLIRFR